MLCCYSANLDIVDTSIEVSGKIKLPSYDKENGLKSDGTEVDIKASLDVFDQELKLEVGTENTEIKTSINIIDPKKVDIEIVRNGNVLIDTKK